MPNWPKGQITKVLELQAMLFNQLIMTYMHVSVKDFLVRAYCTLATFWDSGLGSEKFIFNYMYMYLLSHGQQARKRPEEWKLFKDI